MKLNNTLELSNLVHIHEYLMNNNLLFENILKRRVCVSYTNSRLKNKVLNENYNCCINYLLLNLT